MGGVMTEEKKKEEAKEKKVEKAPVPEKKAEKKAEAQPKAEQPKKEEDARKLTAFMCTNFFDIRAFGAVMTTEVNCGQVRGPVQLGFARSIDPIMSQEHALTRCAVTNERDLEKERTMGRKFTVPYGLYRVHGFINPHLAEQTGFGQEDPSRASRAVRCGLRRTFAGFAGAAELLSAEISGRCSS